MKNKKIENDISFMNVSEKLHRLMSFAHQIDLEVRKSLPTEQYGNFQQKYFDEMTLETEAFRKHENTTQDEHLLKIQTYLLENFFKHLPDKSLKDFDSIKDLKKQCLLLLKRIHDIEIFRGLATPNDLRIATIGTKKELKWRDIDKQHKDRVKELLKSTAPEILSRLEDDENPDEIISQFIGIKLVHKELRILKTLRAIVDRAYKLGDIQDYSHQTRIYTADFYKEYGLKPRKEGGYDDNQTQPIRKILLGSGNLTKRIFFNNSKHQKVMVTAFVLKLEWETDNNYFEVMLDDIIFVKDKSDEYSYYYENLQGLNRLMELMPNSNSAFELHEYLEYSLKTANHEFGLTKLLKASPTLEKRYTKDRHATIQRLEKILNGMIKAETLITAWKKGEGRNEIKYTLSNIYKGEKDTKASNKKTTYNRKAK